MTTTDKITNPQWVRIALLVSVILNVVFAFALIYKREQPKAIKERITANEKAQDSNKAVIDTLTYKVAEKPKKAAKTTRDNIDGAKQNNYKPTVSETDSVTIARWKDLRGVK